MFFSHSHDIWTQCPELVPGVVFAQGIHTKVSVGPQVERFSAIAASRLAAGGEGRLQEIQAWRRVFAQMGLPPTKYRCAAEALLRRLRKENALPRLHPLVDLCNAISAAFAIPVAVFDVSQIVGHLEVRHASGAENYLTFAGELEHPAAQEVIYADPAGNAHARRWTNRQGRLSAVVPDTQAVLIVAEGVHDIASQDVRTLVAALLHELPAVWPAATLSARVLTRAASRFEFEPARKPR